MNFTDSIISFILKFSIDMGIMDDLLDDEDTSDGHL